MQCPDGNKEPCYDRVWCVNDSGVYQGLSQADSVRERQIQVWDSTLRFWQDFPDQSKHA